MIPDPNDTTDELEVPQPGEPLAQAAGTGPGQSLTARALRSLPERWRAVLWPGDLEEATPARIAERLSSTESGAAALSHRALDGLRAAYQRIYLDELTRPRCRLAAGKLGDHVRRALSRRDTRLVSRHLGGCAPCGAIYADLVHMDGVLRGVIAPLILDGGTGARLAAAPPAAPAAPALPAPRPRRGGPGRRRAAAAAGAALALVAVAAVATLLTVNSRPARSARHRAAAAPPAAAAPAPPPGGAASAGPGPSSAASTRLARPGPTRSPAPSRRPRPDASPTAGSTAPLPPASAPPGSAPPASPSPPCLLLPPLRLC